MSTRSARLVVANLVLAVVGMLAPVVGVGFEIGYNWLLGANRNFDVSIGVGATRLFGDDLDGASMTLPTVRLVNLGFAF